MKGKLSREDTWELQLLKNCYNQCLGLQTHLIFLLFSGNIKQKKQEM